jgi:uncharacterized protein involved in outer membrane biogenesis
MTRTRIRWLEIGLIVVAAVGGIVAVLAGIPGLVDVEGYKPGLIQAVREATGRELVIDGPMRFRMFPVPGIGAGTVRFANAVGAKGAQMIDVRWVAVRPSWSALLHGRVEVGTLTLYQPTIVLETDAEGRPNWEFNPGGNAKQAADAPSAGFHLALGRLEIVNGTVTYTDPKTKTKFSAEEVTGGASVDSFDGPFEIDAKATVNNVPLKLALAVGAPTPNGHKARVNLQVSSGELDFKGQVGAIALDTTVQGHLSVKTGVLSDFVTSVFGAVGAAKPAFDTSGAGRFSFDGDIEIAPDHLAARDFDVSMGKDDAKGTVSLAYKPVPTLEGKLQLSRIDVGKWLALLARPIDFTPDPVKAVTTAPTPEAAAAKATVAVAGPSPWAKVDAHLTVDIAEVLYNNDTIRNVSASLDMKQGVVVVPRLKAAMPGGLTLDADAEKGTLHASASHWRDTLQWLGLETRGIPAGKLQAMTMDGTLAAKAGALVLSDGTFKLDGVPGKVAGTLSLKAPLTAALDVGMDRFDLDAYMPKPATTPEPTKPPPPVKPAAARTATDGPSFGLKVDIAKLVYRGETLGGVTGGVTLADNALKLDNIKVADLLGAKAGLSGQVSDFGSVPRFDVAFNVAAPDTDRLLDYAGLPKFLNGKIGPGTATGNVAGTREAVTVRNVAAHFLDSDARASGTLAFTTPATFDFTSFNLQTPEAGKLISVASGRPMSGLGAITAAGSLKGSPDRSVFTGNLTVRGSAMSGTLDATLGRRPKLAANLKVPRTLDIDALLGIQDDSAPAPLSPDEVAPEVRHTRPARKATPKPIDLTALRSFDADLVVSAKAMSMSALTVDYADLDATLKDGVFRINKLTGQFYKGAVDFAGTIDASGQALAIDAKGSLLGMHVEELLRGTVGGNVFGQSAFRITIDGKLDANAIRLTGKGRSATELRESLSTATTLSGTLATHMGSSAQTFAQFATGIGSIFSDTTAFDRLILSGFINVVNQVSGGVVLGGGTITLKDQRVQGYGAIAVISGQNHLADETTNTTIDVSSGNRRYVARITGKLSSPNITADSKQTGTR